MSKNEQLRRKPIIFFFPWRADVCSFVQIALLRIKGSKACHDIVANIDFYRPYRLWYSLLSESCFYLPFPGFETEVK